MPFCLTDQRPGSSGRKRSLAFGLALLAPSLAFLAQAKADPSGAALFGQNCAMCHQADASGSPGQYPPLKNRVDKIAATPGGQHYLADVLTHGLAGSIQAGGAAYVGYMPAFAQLQDDQIAAVLSYVSSLGDSKPAPVIAAADVAAARARALTPATVAQERTALGAQHPLP